MQGKNDKTIADNDVFREILQKEQSYNESLTLLEQGLIIEVHLKHEVLRQLKGPISTLKEISDKLLAQKSKALDPNTTEREHKELRMHRLQYLKLFCEALKIYAPIYRQFLEEYKRQPELFQAINHYFTKHCKGLNLEAHLIRPLQKGPHYVMLFGAVRKHSAYLTENNLEEINELERLVNESSTSLHKKETSDAYYFGKYTVNAARVLFGPAAAKPAAAPANPMHVISMEFPQKPAKSILDEKEFVLIAEQNPDAVTSDLTP